jgi:diguanylate cyclase (GGDEF)-like protein
VAVTAPVPEPIAAGHIALTDRALGLLMPLHLRIDPAARVTDAGPTLRKIAGPGLVGRHLSQVFQPLQPETVTSAADLLDAGALRLRLRGPAGTVFKGAAAALADRGGALVNLSFSYGLREAVADHALSASDFAATDLAFELLYLAEANAAVMAEAKRASDRLRGARARAMEQALTDPLTGLRNRRGLDRTLERLTTEREVFGLIHVDLDHFKQVNDTLGHAAGDSVLVEVARRLRRAVRDDDSVARLGGDEFVVLLPGLRERAGIEAVARRLLSDLGQPHHLPGLPPRPISASLGVALWCQEGPVSIDALLLAADRALYASKDAGRGRVTFAYDGLDRAG